LWVVLFPGIAEVQAAWRNIDPVRLSFFSGGKSVLATLEAWAVPVFGSIAAQELVSRALATRSPEVARRSALLGGGLYLLVGLIPAFLGLVGIGLLPKLDDPEQFLPTLARQYLPPFLFVLFAGALVSAILSTVDSTLLAASSLTTHNLVLPLWRDTNEADKVRLARAGVVIFGLVAWGLALSADTMFELVEGSSAFGSAGVFAILVFGLFTKLGGARSAYAALLAGLLVWVAGHYVWELEFVYLLSLAGAFATYCVVGLFEMATGNKSVQNPSPT